MRRRVLMQLAGLVPTPREMAERRERRQAERQLRKLKMLERVAARLKPMQDAYPVINQKLPIDESGDR